jgi:hypothetical protein
MSSLALPIRPAPTEPFRFLELPGEIRNKVYAILLIVPELVQQSQQDADPPLRLNLETQILRVCRMINSESRYVLRSANLFVKLTFKTPVEIVLRITKI